LLLSANLILLTVSKRKEYFNHHSFAKNSFTANFPKVIKNAETFLSVACAGFSRSFSLSLQRPRAAAGSARSV
jgi:hypothetical protein